VWARFVKDFYNPIVEAEPHDGLKALAELQHNRFGASKMSFITMNVDGLHQAAGSHAVAEVHGSARRFFCGTCGAVSEPALPLDASVHPCCGRDGCNGPVRPDVTLFTEALPEDQAHAAMSAIHMLRDGDVMLVVGTSSVVYPAASLPSLAKSRGATLIEFNSELPTPLSDLVDVAVQGRAAETLRTCVDAVLRDIR